MRTPRSERERIDRAMRSFESARRQRSWRRLLAGWSSALLLLAVAASALRIGSTPAPGADPVRPATAVRGDSPSDVAGGSLRIRLVDDTGPTVPPTTDLPTTGPPTTDLPTTGPPTTDLPTTGPPTTDLPTTVPPTTDLPTTDPTTVPPTTDPTTVPLTTKATTTTSTTVPVVVPPAAPPAPAIVTPPPPSPPAPPVAPEPVPPTEPSAEPAADPEPSTVKEDEPAVEEPESEAAPSTTRPAAPAPAPVAEPPAPGPESGTGTGIAASEISSFGSSLSTFGNGDLSPGRIGTNTVLAAVLSLLIILPAELFNATLRVNYELVLSPLQRLRDASTAVIESLQRRLPGSRLVGTVIFAVIAALASSALDPRFGLGWGSLRLLVAQTLALFASTFAVCRISLLIGRRYGVGGEIALRPGGLVLCFAVVLLSRSIGVSPGFLYGLVVGLQFHAPMSIERVGRIALVQAGFLLTLGVSSWLVLGLFHDVFAGSSPGLLPSLGAEVLTSLSIGTTTGLVLSMMPLTYLRGERLFVWKRPLWFLTYSLVFFAFLCIAVNPVFGSLPSTDSLRLWLGLYALFGVGSVLFWLRYRNTENRSALDRLTEALPRL